MTYVPNAQMIPCLCNGAVKKAAPQFAGLQSLVMNEPYRVSERYSEILIEPCPTTPYHQEAMMTCHGQLAGLLAEC